MTLLDAFAQIPDHRRAQGTRHRLPCVLVCLVLSALSGNRSWRAHRDFIQRHHEALVTHLHLPKARLPSYSTLRRVLLGLNYQDLSTAFLRWARQHVSIEEGEWVAADGKSLRGTLTNVDGAQQNFSAIVSLYARKRGVVLQSQAFENKEESEIHVLLSMLADADLKGASMTADALHCRKKPWPRSATPVPTT
jgi:DDE_Tnp_1-associated